MLHNVSARLIISRKAAHGMFGLRESDLTGLISQNAARRESTSRRQTVNMDYFWLADTWELGGLLSTRSETALMYSLVY